MPFPRSGEECSVKKKRSGECGKEENPSHTYIIFSKVNVFSFIRRTKP
jgi:hypothetical protein